MFLLNINKFSLDFEKQIANLDGGYKKKLTSENRHGVEWHRAIDRIINGMKTKINEINIKHRDIL